MTKRRYDLFGVTDHDLQGAVAAGRLGVEDRFIHRDETFTVVEILPSNNRHVWLRVKERDHPMSLSRTIQVQRLRRRTQ